MGLIIASSLQLMILLGTLVASLVTWGTSSMKTNAVFAPTMLLSKNRVEEATESLRRIPKDKSEDKIKFEIQAIQHARSNDHKGKWSEIFDVKNRRCTMVATLAMFGQQITGQAFASQYCHLLPVAGIWPDKFCLFLSYIVLSEAASSHIKEKTNLLASVISVLTTFATSFTLPYLLSKPYAALGAKASFIYGSFCVAMVVLAYFFIPELKGRSLKGF
ncbi:hexose transporter 2 [Fusarium sp. NRRL 52700]|nr:hexose transporter 2 [Fusarium sp. NRRL 52700]